MDKWYRKSVAKAVALISGVLGGAAFITSLAVAMTLAGTMNPAEIMGLVNEPYEESWDFSLSVENAMFDVFRQSRLKDLFETEGAFNPDKPIDVIEYTRAKGLEEERYSGIEYTLEELIDWGEAFSSGGSDVYSDNEVIVCKRPDGGYYYYYLDDFLLLFDSQQLFMEFTGDTSMSQEEYLGELETGSFTTSNIAGGLTIRDQEGFIVYTDCWNFGSSLRERYAPQGADNLLQIVNNSQQYNGQLSSIYERIEETLSAISEDYTAYEAGWDYLGDGNTNFTYMYIDTGTKKVETNKSEYKDYEDAERHLQEMKSGDNVRYVFVYPKLKDFETNMNLSATGEWQMVNSQKTDRKVDSIFAVAVDTDYPIKDQFYEGKVSYEQNMTLLRNSVIGLFSGVAVFLVSALWLALTAGKRAEDEEIHLTAFDRWKTEIAAAVILLIWGGVTYIVFAGSFLPENWQALEDAVAYYADRFDSMPQLYSMLFTSALGLSDVMRVFSYAAFSFLLFFLGYVSLIRRARAKILWKGSMLYAVISFIGKALRTRPLTARAGVVVLVFLIIQWFAILWNMLPAVLLALIADGAAVWLILESAMAKGRIKKGIEEIAQGNLEYRIDLNGLRGGDRDLGEKVNNIGSGLNKAVDEATRNERLKTDLITNVSHDIKTPLTSIINYVDILKRSDIADEKIRGYLDILEAKAQRLKTLTEDVVEASKVSSGNITLEYMDVDLRELVQQTEGELAEKFAARNLTVVLNMPEEPAVIRVDGRRMWRVLENVFGNAAKYAMPGTRVYADLTLTEGAVRFSLKNVSEQQLNFSADELTERFIRGDISRSTEGSGLGLSIAKSLTTMQGGEFELYLDGDLFKVDISFPRR